MIRVFESDNVSLLVVFRSRIAEGLTLLSGEIDAGKGKFMAFFLEKTGVLCDTFY